MVLLMSPMIAVANERRARQGIAPLAMAGAGVRAAASTPGRAAAAPARPAAVAMAPIPAAAPKAAAPVAEMPPAELYRRMHAGLVREGKTPGEAHHEVAVSFPRLHAAWLDDEADRRAEFIRNRRSMHGALTFA